MGYQFYMGKELTGEIVRQSLKTDDEKTALKRARELNKHTKRRKELLYYYISILYECGINLLMAPFLRSHFLCESAAK